MSATRPCCEFSIGMMAEAARPDVTASSASSKLKQGIGRQPGSKARAALCAFALATAGQSGAHAQGAARAAEPVAYAIDLRLADGGIIRVPCDKAGNNCTAAPVPQNAWITGSARRAPLKRGAKLFDARQPGVVASIRG